MALFKKDKKNLYIPAAPFVLQDFTRMPFAPLADTPENYIKQGYESNADLFSVINLLASNAANVKIILYRVSGDKMDQVFTHPLLDLLRQPMPGMTYRKWITQVTGYYWLTGNAFIYAPWLESGANRGKTVKLPFLPSQYVQISLTDNGEKQYRIGVEKQKVYSVDEVLHLSTAQYDYGAGRELYGMSPIKAALYNLSASNDGTKSQAARFQNGGLDGMLGVKDAKSEEQIKSLKLQLQQQSGTDKSGRLLITSSELDYVRFGLSPADLQILQTVTWNLRTFCNIYAVDPKLLDPTTGNTYNNMREAYASMYNRAIIPVMSELVEGLNNWLVPRYQTGGEKLLLVADTSGIQELQKDKQQQAGWLRLADYLTPNEKRVEMGYEPINDPEMEVPHLQNSTPIGLDPNAEKFLNERGFTDYRT